MTAETFTNTLLATGRRCLTELDLGYDQKLASDGEDSEALQVGQAWHAAHHADAEARDVYAEIGGRRGVLERKTTGDSLDAESAYWERLRLDVQVGLYSLACGFEPAFILYDVVRKPTIRPKDLTKKIVARMKAELAEGGTADYYAEAFTAAQLEGALEEGRETLNLYGARLTSDIGDQPSKYFARREVHRTTADYDTLLDNLDAQVQVIRHARAHGLMHRNPDNCNAFGRCKFFGLCSNNIRPREGDPAPVGFHVREHLHPELAPTSED